MYMVYDMYMVYVYGICIWYIYGICIWYIYMVYVYGKVSPINMYIIMIV